MLFSDQMVFLQREIELYNRALKDHFSSFTSFYWTHKYVKVRKNNQYFELFWVLFYLRKSVQGLLYFVKICLLFLLIGRTG